jgi:hypothetical protein
VHVVAADTGEGADSVRVTLVGRELGDHQQELIVGLEA